MAEFGNTMAGWHFSEEEIGQSLRGDRMINPSLDLSNPCNLNCPYCFIEEKNSHRKVRKPNELTIEETFTVIHDFRSAGAATVNLVGAGEPTIDPHFQECVAEIVALGMHCVLFTNGIRIAEDVEFVKFLHEHHVTVVLKFNSPDHTTQDLVAGRRGYTNLRDTALERLRNWGFNADEPTRLALDIMAFEGNRSDIPKIHRWCRENGVFPIAADFIPTGRTLGGRFAGEASLVTLSDHERDKVEQLLQPLSSQERDALHAELVHIDREFGIHHQSHPAYYCGAGCTQILGLYVDIVGNIWPCVARTRRGEGAEERKPLGSIREGILPSQIWRGHPYMHSIRVDYDGGCPYKRPISARNRIASNLTIRGEPRA